MSNNINVLTEIIYKLEKLEDQVTDKWILCAVQANLLKYKKQLEEEYKKNALDIVAYKIRHLTAKLII